ncbi:hypothetical protein [Saccharothrix sp. ST-888]|uniref:hypothetical protein n=1 Tax=Saccharothrix sp. ST-888 TaxID=1427391 RepID=UPI0012E00A32|nr:hypothetical protein [Saccharothrix sp. ST-888]
MRIEWLRCGGDGVAVFIGEQHDYETPEVVGVPLVTGSRANPDWVVAETAT